MLELVNDYIEMNQAGLVLELCEKYYDENVIMLNNGAVFASSMRESYNKQKGFVDALETFDVSLVSKLIEGNVSELTFHYKMKGADAKVIDFIGKHVQTWRDNKIIREEYLTVEDAKG